MAGQLVTGSAVARGILFALAWGGLMAGVLGSVFFVRAETGPPTTVIETPDVGRLLGLLAHR